MERLCLYEWATAGGLEGPDGRSVAAEPAVAAAIRQEGLAMLSALAQEAAASPLFDTRVLLGEGVAFSAPAGVHVVRIPRGRECDGLVTAAAACDWLLPVAPETDGILERRLRHLQPTGCRLACPSVAFVKLAADKQATAQALAAVGVPVPAGCGLPAGERPPAAFRRPMVRKRRASTGCDGFAVIRHRREGGDAALHDERIEAFVAGLPVSVSILCGPACRLPLPPVLQRFSAGEQPAYLGGRLPIPRSLVPRAQRLAIRAIEAVARIAPAAGWVGVDMILGDREDGRGDRVLEINPRVTTSFVGLARCSTTNLIEAMVAAASGEVPSLAFGELSEEHPWEFASALPC